MESFLSTVSSQYRNVYKDHWSTIQPSVKKGTLKDTYHFPLSENDQIVGKFQQVIENYNKRVKVNVAFGFILGHKETGELKFYHPSNNTMVFGTAQVVSDSADKKNIENEIEREDLLELASRSRPSTIWNVETIACIRFDVYRL